MSLGYAFDPERVTYFASTKRQGKIVAFGIKAKDRLQHIYTIGKTGTGKSTLLENMAVQDILNDEGLCFIDPHGASAEKLLKYIPKHRVKDTLYFSPFDLDYPVAFNILEDLDFDKRHIAVSGILSIFKRIWKDAWSSRMEYILQNTLLALLEYPNTTLLDINRMLVNPEFRRDVVASVSDPIVKRFWAEEFANYSDRYAQEATPAIQNKIGQFASNPLVRNIIGQSRSSFSFREAMDEQKIVIVNLSKGKLGDLNANLLGSLITSKLYLEAMSRADKELDSLPPFYTYIDEFHNLLNDSFADILSEARKYRLSLTLAHQYIEQLDSETRAAIFGNVGTSISFKIGPKDAEIMEGVFASKFKAEDFVNLAFAEIYLSLLIDGNSSPPFSAKTLPPVEDAPYDFSDEIIKESRAQFARSRAGVEEFIAEIDRKRGSAHLQKANTSPKEYKEEKSYGDTKDMQGQKSAPYVSPAEIIKEELAKEPQGVQGPSDLQSKKSKKAVPDRQSIKKILSGILGAEQGVEQNPNYSERKSDSQSSNTVQEQVSRHKLSDAQGNDSTLQVSQGKIHAGESNERYAEQERTQEYANTDKTLERDASEVTANTERAMQLLDDLKKSGEVGDLKNFEGDGAVSVPVSGTESSQEYDKELFALEASSKRDFNAQESSAHKNEASNTESAVSHYLDSALPKQQNESLRVDKSANPPGDENFGAHASKQSFRKSIPLQDAAMRGHNVHGFQVKAGEELTSGDEFQEVLEAILKDDNVHDEGNANNR